MSKDSNDSISGTSPQESTTALLQKLPDVVREQLSRVDMKEEDLLIATTTDVNIAGEYTESWLLVNREKVAVFVLDDDEQYTDNVILARELPLSAVDKVRTDSRVGSGFLEVQTDGAYEELVRFSNKHAEKFTKVAAVIRSLLAGQEVAVLPVTGAEATEGATGPFDQTPHTRVRRGTVFFRFISYARGFWPYAGLVMILVVCTIVLMVLPQQLVKVLIDQVFEQKEDGPGWFTYFRSIFGVDTRITQLYMLVGMLASITLLMAIIGTFKESLAVWINNRLGFQLRRDVFGKMQDLALRYHESMPVGQLMTRCSQDIETLQSFINQLTSGFGFQLLQVVGVAVMMFTENWRLALIACVPAPFVMMCTLFFTRRITPLWRKYWARRSDLTSGLHSSLSGIRVVKAFAQERRENRTFGIISEKFKDVGLHVGFANARFYPVMAFVFQLGAYFIWISGGSAIIEGREGGPSIGELMAFLGYLGMFYAPLNSLTQMSTWFTQFTTQAHRVFEVLDQESEIAEDDASVDLSIQGAINFRDVNFGYDPHLPVLKGVNFQVRPGEMIGIVGHSGCGKSTTVSLLMRFYEPNDGEILIDNINIKKIQKQSLRRQVGLVAQDPFLFRGTVAENIAYGNPEAAPENVLDAALQANAHMFITRNHDGYDARLGERGAGLSGGERQRVAIARALLHNPRVLILDEATSSVDTIAEREIQGALEALSRGRTTIAIAHRLTTLRNCDRILVFEEGEIREQGSHDELMAQQGIYHKLVQTQTELDGGVKTIDGLQAMNELNEAEAKVKATVHQRNTLVPRIHYLDPKELHVYSLPNGSMRVDYEGESYDNARAYRCFPVSRPHEFIALWVGDTALEQKEVGMIRRLKEVSPSSLVAVEHELNKRYFIHYIDSIESLRPNRYNMAFLDWEVHTDKGPKMFSTMRWERGAVVEGGKNGRIIFDIDENRYEIVDMDALDATSRNLFEGHIFW